MQSMKSSSTLLEIADISKKFYAIQALDSVSLKLKTHTITALIGENGAGKSTLVKILAGYYQPDSGLIKLDGKTVSLQNVVYAQSQGISVIHQVPAFAPDLSVVDNIFLGRELSKNVKGRVLSKHDRSAEIQNLKPLLSQYGANFKPEVRMGQLKAYQQRLVGIIRALVFSARILIMDEPTAALPLEERELLLSRIRQLRDDGYCILYVSHHMDEIEKVADEVAALRNGKLVGYADTVPTQDRMIEMMTGDRLRSLSEMYDNEIHDFKRKARTDSDPIRTSYSFSLNPPFSSSSSTLVQKPVSLTVNAGELVVLTGIVGSGAKDIAEAMYGMRTDWQVVLSKDETPFLIRNPKDAIKHSIGYLSDDRLGEAMISDFSIRENITISMLEKVSRYLIRHIILKDEKRTAGELCKNLKVKMHSIEQTITDLSGGNQQKVMLARWLFAEVGMLILNEPTQGVDVMAKRDVIRLLRELTAMGGACIIATNDPEEFLHIADRVLVMRKGIIVGDFSGSAIKHSDVFQSMLIHENLGLTGRRHERKRSE
jgi:ABC-type sugar transport system ATPase subunit